MFCHFNMSTDIKIKNVKKLQPFKNMTIFFKCKKIFLHLWSGPSQSSFYHPVELLPYALLLTERKQTLGDCTVLTYSAIKLCSLFNKLIYLLTLLWFSHSRLLTCNNPYNRIKPTVNPNLTVQKCRVPRYPVPSLAAAGARGDYHLDVFRTYFYYHESRR